MEPLPSTTALLGVLFDLDGVLVDSRAAIAGSLNHALAAAGLAPMPAERLHPLIGPPLHDALAGLLAEQGADPGRVEELVALYRAHYARACVEETLPVAGVGPVLEALRGRTALGVATSKPVRFAGPILRAVGLARFFGEAVTGPALEARSEPKRETVARALARWAGRWEPGSPPAGRVAMVGDREHDVAAGRAHGLVTVGVTWGIGSESELRSAGADHLVHTPDELAALLLAWTG